MRNIGVLPACLGWPRFWVHSSERELELASYDICQCVSDDACAYCIEGYAAGFEQFAGFFVIWLGKDGCWIGFRPFDEVIKGFLQQFVFGAELFNLG